MIIHVNERHLFDEIKDIFSDLARNESGSLDKILEGGDFERVKAEFQGLRTRRDHFEDLSDRLSGA